MLLHLIRHADPIYETDTITPEGVLEAQALAERVAGMKIDRIYCSPMGRAIATMMPTIEKLKMPYEIQDWMAEMSHCPIELETEGQVAMWNVPGEMVRGGSCMPGHDNCFELPVLSEPKLKERVQQVRDSSDEFLTRHGYQREGGRYRIVEPNQERIAIFCHGGFGVTWLAHLLEIPLTLMWTGFWLAPTSVTSILFEERSKQWAVPRCLALGDTSHLYKAGLAVKPRGVLANVC